MKRLILILAVLFVTATAFALPGDPPLHGGGCDPEAKDYLDSPDFPMPVSLVFKAIGEQAEKMFKVKVAPYLEINPETGREFYRRRYQPQVDAAQREVWEWERRVKEKAEKYVEVDPCLESTGLIIRKKYLDLIW